MNLQNNYGKGNLEVWKILWTITCYSLCYCRNKKIHDKNYIRHTMFNDDINIKFRYYIRSFDLQRRLDISTQTLVRIMWKPSHEK